MFFPHFIRAILTSIPSPQVRRRTSGLFAPVEQAWHLADLEIEGYGSRIAQLLHADGPHFLDFDGETVAEQRHYLDLDLESALIRFESARTANLALLSFATADQRRHRATQQGVEGPVTLDRVEQMMAEHDASHAAEINQLLADFGLPLPAAPVSADKMRSSA